MKTKILKKLIAVLCAAAMSTSIVVPTGAIDYTSNDTTYDQEKALQNLNYAMKVCRKTWCFCKKDILKNNKENEKLISSITDNIDKLLNETIPINSQLANELNSGVCSVIESIKGIIYENVDAQEGINKINLKINELLDKINKSKNINKEEQERERLAKLEKEKKERLAKLEKEKKERLAKLEKEKKERQQELKQEVDRLWKEVNNKNAEMVNLIESAKKLTPNFYEITSLQAAKYINSIQSKNFNALKKGQLEKAIKLLDIAIKNLKALNSKLQDQSHKNIDELKKKLDSMEIKFYRTLSDAQRFAEHRRLKDTSPIEKAKKDFYEKCSNLGDVRKDAATMQDAIKCLDEQIRSLNMFINANQMTVIIPGELSALKREASDKVMELDRLHKCAKKQRVAYPLRDEVSDAIYDSWYVIISRDPDSLKERLENVIKVLSDYINKLKIYDDGNLSQHQEWQIQAHNNIDNLLVKAKKEMEDSRRNKDITIGDLRTEFEGLLCGTQAMGNCWLHAVRNIMNFSSKFKPNGRDMQKIGVVQNNGKRDNDDNFDAVENFFVKNGISKNVVSKGGTLDQESEMLSKFNINHVTVDITVEKRDIKSANKNQNIVKTLLLKHFANSKAPVLVSVKYDKKAFDKHNRTGSFHSMVVVGYSLKNDSVLVADSNFKTLQVYTLDNIARTLSDNGTTDVPIKHIEMIFPSFNSDDNFEYDNTVDSWKDFESKLLPAISK